METIRVKGLGLAAYVKMRGGEFIAYDRDSREFAFRADTSVNWEVEYANSDCYRHDAEVMNLRKFMR